MDLLRYLPIAYPQALALGALLAWLYARRLKRRNLWRLAALAAAILLLGYPVMRRSNRAFDLYVLADRSRSISEEGRAKQAEVLDLIARKMAPGDRLGVVSFNDRSYVEQAPGSGAAVRSFAIPFSQDASDLADGLGTVLNLADPDRPAKVLVLSDGEYTGTSPLREAQTARGRGIPVFYRNLARTGFFNLSAREADLPAKILAREPFRVAFRVGATAAAPGRYRLLRDGRAVGAENSQGWRAYDFQAGVNTIAFNDAVEAPGIHGYRLEVETVPRERESVFEDNAAERFVKVVGERPILVVNGDGGKDNVTAVLTAAGLPVHAVGIGAYRLGMNQLAGYQGVVLNNVPLLDLALSQIEALRDFVLQEGGGLLVCGGPRSFGRGGYYLSPLDPILPVSLEDRQQSRKTSTAFSIIIDRSGSMSMPVPGGQQKIQLADEAVAKCIELMSPVDSVSVIAVDSLAHIMVPQQEVKNPRGIIGEVRRIESMGGGIFVYTGLVAAASEILKAKQINKHILLFADADDSEEEGDYKALLDKLVDAGVTVSVVGLGKETDSTAAFQKDIAARGKGSMYFTEDAAQLTQFFTADTITYTRNNFVEEPAPMVPLAAARSLAPDLDWPKFTCPRYNLLFKRPDANVAIQTADDDRAPILAFWQRGLGRAASLAVDAAGPFGSLPRYPDILLSAARWVTGAGVEDSFDVRVDYEGSYARIRMEVSDEDRRAVGLARLRLFSPDGTEAERALQWDGPGRLSALVKLDKPGLYRGVIQAGGKTFKTDPVSMPVSPEFLHDREPDFGRRTLSQMAGLTGGREVLDVRDLFERKTKTWSVRPVAIPVLVFLLLALLLDIAEARFGLEALLAAAGRGAWARTKRLGARLAGKGAAPAAGRVPGGATAEAIARSATASGRRFQAAGLPAEKPSPAAADAAGEPGGAKPAGPPAPPATPPSDGGLDYLARSRGKARKRL